jgi:hypothetical protein
MLPENALGMRLTAAIGFTLAAAMSLPAAAADRSLSDDVTNAFQTIVIDATKAAAQAKAAAEDALTERKSRSKKTSKDGKAAAQEDKAGTAQDGKAAGNAPSDPAAEKSGAKTGAASDKQAAPDKAASEKKDAPADKAADPAAKKPAVQAEWPAVDVELAKARCTQLLKGLDVVTIPEPPFRKGDCGSMAPVRLVSIGKNPEVSLSPPAVVSCDMVVALAKWMKESVQPAAKRHLGGEVIRIESMSDYSCRMAYGRVGNKLSEHGKANALDIRSFTTRKGEEAVVLTGWGLTKRDVKKQIAEAKAAAAKAEAVKVAAEQASKERAERAEFAAKAETTDTPLPRKTLVEGLPPRRDETPGLALPAAMVKEGAFDKHTGLDGPKASKSRRKEASARKGKSDATVAALPAPGDEDKPVEAPKPATPTARFLHETHAAACRIFGTTLGPEANEAHRNHFHVDMAERKYRKICD